MYDVLEVVFNRAFVSGRLGRSITLYILGLRWFWCAQEIFQSAKKERGMISIPPICLANKGWHWHHVDCKKTAGSRARSGRKPNAGLRQGAPA